MAQKHVQPFNAFTIKYAGCVNRIITPIRLTVAFDPQTVDLNTVTYFETKALWDTGATKSVVTSATATNAGLVPVGNTIVNHAGGSSIAKTYLINVLLPNTVGVSGVIVSECPDIVGDFGAIVGMDIISFGDITISNHNNQTWMTFRIPSYKNVDYVVEANRIAYAGVKPYAPCPCGRRDNNGKPVKFKDCHGKNSN